MINDEGGGGGIPEWKVNVIKRALDHRHFADGVGNKTKLQDTEQRE